jgi:hypothetical protein
MPRTNKETSQQEGSTDSTHRNGDCRLNNTLAKHNKYVVNQYHGMYVYASKSFLYFKILYFS